MGTQVQVPMQPCGWCECKKNMQMAGQGKPERSGISVSRYRCTRRSQSNMCGIGVDTNMLHELGR